MCGLHWSFNILNWKHLIIKTMPDAVEMLVYYVVVCKERHVPGVSRKNRWVMSIKKIHKVKQNEHRVFVKITEYIQVTQWYSDMFWLFILMVVGSVDRFS